MNLNLPLKLILLFTFGSQETQNDFDKLKRDQLSKEIVSLEEQERDLLEFIKQNEEMDPEKAVKFKAEAKVRSSGGLARGGKDDERN